MKKTASLILDVGGQSVMALVLDDQARPVAEARRKLDTSEREDRVEQDPAELVDALLAVVDETLAAMGAAASPAVTQAALAVQRGSIVCWDRQTGQALSPVLSWRDRRSLPRLQHLNEQAEAIRQRTGLRFSPYAGAPKIAWCLSELPAVRAAADQGRLVCGPLGSFLLARLAAGSPLRVDHSLAQRTLLWSRSSFAWDPWLQTAFGIRPGVLPDIVPSRSDHGLLANTCPGTALSLLIGDQNCLPFVDGRPDPETLYINLGTGAFLLRPMPEPVDDPRFQCTLIDAASPPLWALEGSIHGAAAALSWLERQHKVQRSAQRGASLREAVRNPPLFLNTIDGLGSPWWRPGVEPAFVETEPATANTPEALLLAVLESIAFLIRANVEVMAETIGQPGRLVVCGGLSQSDALCGLIADALGKNLRRLRAVEGTALGSWCLLHGRSLPEAHFEPVLGRCDPELERRYRRWHQIIGPDNPAVC